MIVLILFAVPALLYAAVWVASWRGALDAAPRPLLDPAGAQRPPAAGWPPWLLALGLSLHAGSLFWPFDDVFRFGFAKALSSTMWIGLMLLWLEGLRMRIDALRVLILPLAIVSLLLPLAWPGGDFSALAHRPLFAPHLVVGTLAYGVLLLAALHAMLMLVVQRDLESVHEGPRVGLSRWIDGLPPLMALERILFRLIAVGFVLLLLTTASGLLFSEQVFGTPLRLEHKTVFSLVALAFFGILLAGRRVRGWRGRIAMRFTLGGFTLLMLGYVGSRFVLEVVLRRF
jgi:ABC-type uncharacterized transport system permease subunit